MTENVRNIRMGQCDAENVKRREVSYTTKEEMRMKMDTRVEEDRLKCGQTV